MSTKKGFSFYYKIIRKGKNLSNNMAIREQKWHLELEKTFSVYFWENARKLCAGHPGSIPGHATNFSNFSEGIGKPL